MFNFSCHIFFLEKFTNKRVLELDNSGNNVYINVHRIHRNKLMSN